MGADPGSRETPVAEVTPGRQSGLIFQINRQILHPFGMELKDGRIVDISDDNPNGLTFSAEEYKEGNDAFIKFMREEGLGRIKRRHTVLGIVAQPPPEEENAG